MSHSSADHDIIQLKHLLGMLLLHDQNDQSFLLPQESSHLSCTQVRGRREKEV